MNCRNNVLEKILSYRLFFVVKKMKTTIIMHFYAAGGADGCGDGKSP